MSALRQVPIPHDMECLYCGQPWTDSMPPASDVPMRNRNAGVELLVPMHARCARECDLGLGDDGLLARVEHFLTHHSELAS